ncbi:MAG: hypothetical protein J6S31_06525 [Lachnospiraceae bacterium]|nr:hypothetical protein [Lachnospiraceae bacterium]
MKKIIALFLAAILILGLASCGTKENPSEGGSGDQVTELEKHTIGVLVYNQTDDEVIAFKRYLVNYIADAFNVEFLYSGNVTSEEEEQEYLQRLIDSGAEGILSFISYDLSAEVKLCEQAKVYYMMASGTVSDEDFASVEDNPYFLGVIGPGAFIEYKAGSDMAAFFADKKGSNEYFLLSGGAAYGNAMHQRRTQGILDTLASAYNVTFEKSTEELSMSEEPVHIQEGDLKICICPGYISRDQFFEQIKGEYESDQYDTVLSVLGISRMADVVKGKRLGVIDCYSETNLQLFASDNLHYLAGKYSSIIGPSFAVMYNAITGHADEYRPRGKSFHITQGFWSSDSREDFEEKYTLASSIEINAYNYEDLQKVISLFNPEATYEDLKALAEADTFKNALERRAR